MNAELYVAPSHRSAALVGGPIRPVARRRRIGSLPLLLAAARALFSSLAHTCGQPEGLSPRLGAIADEARTAYEAGRFDEAFRLYSTYASSGGEGAEVHYNMGNSALKGGDLGRAILEYRRSLRISPEDGRARHNLDVARRLLPASKTPWQPPPWELFINSVPQRVSEWGVLLAALLANACFLAMFFSSGDRPRRLFAVLMIFFSIAGGAAGIFLYYSLAILPKRQGVVVMKDAPVFQKPLAGGEPLSRLPAGSEVVETASAGGWKMVRWGDGSGWVSAEDVEKP